MFSQGVSMAWGALDDVVMGGRSESGFEVRANVGEDGGRGGMFSGLVRAGCEGLGLPKSSIVGLACVASMAIDASCPQTCGIGTHGSITSQKSLRQGTEYAEYLSPFGPQFTI